MEEGGSDLQLEQEFIIMEDRGKHWRGVIMEYNEDNKKAHAFMWGVYMKYEQEFIKGGFQWRLRI